MQSFSNPNNDLVHTAVLPKSSPHFGFISVPLHTYSTYRQRCSLGLRRHGHVQPSTDFIIPLKRRCNLNPKLYFHYFQNAAPKRHGEPFGILLMLDGDINNPNGNVDNESLSDDKTSPMFNSPSFSPVGNLSTGSPESNRRTAANSHTAQALSVPAEPSSTAAHDRFKVQRRISVGFLMGAVVIAFVFSGRWLFAIGLLAISLTGLYEYYRMVAAKGHSPAYKTGLCVTAATMLFSAFAPHLADVAFPVGATFICIYLLFRRSKIATIADISTTIMGLFYAGYLPSYWIRLHEYTPHVANNVIASAIDRLWPGGLFGFRPTITIGSLLVFWTWLATASADIGAFFVGRTYGRTSFSDISPKKTVEGVIAGFICSASVSILGAFLLRWPLWWATGAVYGITVGILGLCGDLFESCFKRDVGWKDSGSLFPGHGGMLDRADSYVLVAPLVYFFATMVLPIISRVIR